MAEQSLKEKTAKGLFWGGVSNGVQQVLNLLFGLVLARILNAEDYGMVGMLAIFSAIAGTIQESGFTSALTNQKEIRHEDYNAVFWFSVLTGVAFYILLFFCAPLIAAFYGKEELIGLSRLLFLSFVLGGIGIAPNAYLFKTLMVKERAKIDVFSLICSGIVGVTLALNGFTYYGLAIQTTTYIGVGSLLKLFYSPWKPSLSFSWKPLKAMFGFSSKLILTNIFTQISGNLFSVVLGKFYSAQQLGYYSQGQKWMIMGHSLIGGMINNVSQPVLVEVIEDKERLRNVFRKLVRFGAFISFPALLGLALVAKEFIEILFGDKWLPAVPFLQLFCMWGAGGFLNVLCYNLLMALGKSELCLYGTIIINILQIVALMMTHQVGIQAMVIAYVMTCYLGVLMWLYMLKRYTLITIVDVAKDLLPYLLAISISMAITVFVLMQLSLSVVAAFCLKISLTAMIYLSLMHYFNSIIFREVVTFFLRRKNE